MKLRRFGFHAPSICLLSLLPSLFILSAEVTAAAATLPASPVISNADGVWSRFDVVPRNFGHCAIFDPVRDQMIVFGGYLPDLTYSNQTFVWSRSSTPEWEPLDAIDPSQPIPPRALTSAIYDPIGDRMLVFSGDGVASGDVWQLFMAPGSKWQQLTPTGDVPAQRQGHSAIYDSARQRMIVFGGTLTGGAATNEVWGLSLTGQPTWTLLTPQGTLQPARANHSAIYDAANDRMVLLSSYPSYDTWELSFAVSANSPTWTPLAPAGTPPRVHSSGAAYDPAGQRMLVVGYVDLPGGTTTGGTWALSLDGAPAWTQLPFASEPAYRGLQSTVFDPGRRELVMYGGFGDVYANLFAGLWTLSLSGTPEWHPHAGDSGPPDIRNISFGLVDPIRNRLITAGDNGGFPARQSFTGALSLAGLPAWNPVPVYATYATAGVYDPRRDEVITYGGLDPHSGLAFTGPGVYPLSGGPAWHIDSGGYPPAGAWCRLVYDSGHDRVLLVYPGNYEGDEVWSLSLESPHVWTQLTPPDPIPSARQAHAAIFDPVRDRVLMFGGGRGNPTVLFNDLWALGLSGLPQWTQLSPMGTPPPPDGYRGIYDPIRDRMVVMGGAGIWALALSEPLTWSQLAPTGPTPPAFGGWGGYDPALDRLVLQMADPGISYDGSSTWALTWGEPAQPFTACLLAPSHAQPGHTADVTVAIASMLSGPRAMGYRIRSQRSWPGMPVYGTVITDGPQTLLLSVPVPDTAAVGEETLSFSAWYEGAFGYDSGCESQLVIDVPVATLPALETAEAQSDCVTLRWDLAGDAGRATIVYRRDEGTPAWQPLGPAEPVDTRHVVYRDRDVVPGMAYEYQLGIQTPTGEVMLAPARVAVPGAALAIEASTPNPTRVLRVAFVLPVGRGGEIDAYDVSGRRVAHRTLTGLGPGRHEVVLGDALPAGVYMIRLTSESQSLATRVAVVH